ncbi:MAG: IS30 family transposase [Candidatus Azotimanducaceae bacterium]|jgi:IS30 family transposase
MNKENKGNKKNHLTEKERFCIEKMKEAGYTNEDIGKVLGRGTSTISAELRLYTSEEGYEHEKPITTHTSISTVRSGIV